MRKKFLSAFMLGALTLAATSTFVSCKDYDDDVASLQKQINDDKAALENAKTNLEKQIADLKTQLEAKDAELKTLIDKNSTDLAAEIARAKGVEAALETRIQTAEEAITKINELLAGKVDKSEYDTKVAEIEAKIKAVDEKLADEVSKLTTKISDEEKARLAVEADLQQQIDAVKKYKELIDALDAKLKAEVLALQNKDTDLQNQINNLGNKDTDLQNQINALGTTLGEKITNLQTELTNLKNSLADYATKNELQQAMKNMQAKVDAVQAQINVLNVLLDSKLKALVFNPSFYYFGIEAGEITGVNVDYYTLADLNSKLGTPSADAADKTYDPGVIAHCQKVAKTGTEFQVSPSLSQLSWYVNPSNADLKDAKYSFVWGDKNYVGTRAGALEMGVESANVAGGKLTVVPTIKNPEAVKQITVDADGFGGQVTVFALQVTKGDTTVTSDFAALKAVIKTKGYRLYAKYNAANAVKPWYATKAEMLWRDAAQAGYIKTTANVTNETACGVGEGDNSHLFRTSHETVFSTTAVNVNEPKIGNKTAAQFVVPFNGTVNLNQLVGVHFPGVACDNIEDLAKEGLKLQFDLVGCLLANNQTSESAHATISEKDGVYTLRPQLPGTNGKQVAAVEGVGSNPGQQSNSTIGRTPVVRVTLVDTKHDNHVVDYGYIRLVIVDEMPAKQPGDPTVDPTPDLDAYTWSDNTTFDYAVTTYPYGCGTPDKYSLAGNWSINWATFMYKMYVGAGVYNQTEFDAMYSPDLVPGESDVFQQYVVTDGKPTATKAVALGKVLRGLKSNETGEGSGTDVLKWEVTAAEAYAYFGNVDTKDGNRCIRYTLNAGYDKTAYAPYIYVVLNWKGEKYSTVGSKSTATVDFNPRKLSNFWYNAKSNAAGKAEAHLSVASPNDPSAVSPCSTMERPLAYYFKGDKIIDEANVAEVLKVTDNSGVGVNSGANVTYDLVFTVAKHNTCKSASGKTYTLTVANNGKTLQANGEPIAELQGTTVNETKIVYLHNAVSEDILNYTSYKAPKADQLTIDITLAVNGKCEAIGVTGDPIAIIVQRPIDVETTDGKSIQDAGAEVQKLALFDLIESITDWRSENFADHSDYWTYYNVKSITIEGVGEATATTNISNYITTTLDGRTDNPKLSAVSTGIKISYVPAVGGALGTADAYGSILYENNQGDVDQFTVTLPIHINYEWGYIAKSVKVTIKKTLGHAKKH